MELTVKNFQSIADAKLTLEGFTVITGRSNLGKSALFRAASAAVFGLLGDHFIRQDCEHTGVILQDGQDEILWRKTTRPTPQKPSLLRVNGTIHTKLGRDHSQLTAPLGFVELDTAGGHLRPQFAAQHDGPFLLDQTETVAAEVLRMLGRADVITAAQTMAAADRRKEESQLKVREGDLIEAERRLAELDAIEVLTTEWPALVDTVSAHSKLEAKRARLQELSKRKAELAPQPVEAPPTVKLERNPALALLKRRKELEAIELPTPVKLAPYDYTTIDLLRRRETLERERKELAAKANDQARLREEAEAALDTLKQELGVCPLCGSAFHA